MSRRTIERIATEAGQTFDRPHPGDHIAGLPLKSIPSQGPYVTAPVKRALQTAAPDVRVERLASTNGISSPSGRQGFQMPAWQMDHEVILRLVLRASSIPGRSQTVPVFEH